LFDISQPHFNLMSSAAGIRTKGSRTLKH
jgi:hypothetical protein